MTGPLPTPNFAPFPESIPLYLRPHGIRAPEFDLEIFFMQFMDWPTLVNPLDSVPCYFIHF